VLRLRWRDATSLGVVARLHTRVNPLLDEALPDAQNEASDPEEADRRYSDAVAVLRERTRDQTRFPLVFAENVEYGFRRNMLGVRSIGLAVSGLSMVASIIVIVGLVDGGDHAAWTISLVASAVVGLVWWRLVTPEWVRRASDLYTDRLFEAVDSLR